MARLVALVLGATLLGLSATPAGAAPPRPAPDDRLQWQLGDLPADLDVEAEVYDLDLFETTRAEVQQLQDDGRFVVCHLSAGSWRPGERPRLLASLARRVTRCPFRPAS